MIYCQSNLSVCSVRLLYVYSFGFVVCNLQVTVSLTVSFDLATFSSKVMTLSNWAQTNYCVTFSLMRIHIHFDSLIVPLEMDMNKYTYEFKVKKL